MVGLARLLAHVFFRSVEVRGLQRVPATGPVVVVANHTNGLVDPLLLLAQLPGAPFPRQEHAVEAPAAAAVPGPGRGGTRPPSGRRRAGGRGVAAGGAIDTPAVATVNDAAFGECRGVLAAGGAVALFPEGISHDQPTLQPLRTGGARIALGAAFDDGVAGVTVLPVALVFDAKSRFRSRALVRVGEPIVWCAPWAGATGPIPGRRAGPHPDHRGGPAGAGARLRVLAAGRGAGRGGRDPGRAGRGRRRSPAGLGTRDTWPGPSPRPPPILPGPGP